MTKSGRKRKTAHTVVATAGETRTWKQNPNLAQEKRERNLTGGTNSTEERKTGKKATQYSSRTTQNKIATAAELNRAIARQISSRQHWDVN
jgi:hypothetical protein